MPIGVGIMNYNTKRASGAPWLRFLIIVAMLTALTLAAGVACGGDDNRESSSSQPSDQQSLQDGSEEDRDSPTLSVNQDEEEAKNSEPSILSQATMDGEAPSVQDLLFMPNIDFNDVWFVVVADAEAYVGEADAYPGQEVPLEVVAGAESYYDEYFEWATNVLVTNYDEEKPIFERSDLDTVVILHWKLEYIIVAMEGRFDAEAIEKSLDGSERHRRIENVGIDYDVWEYRGDTVALIQERLYVMEEGFEINREFLDPAAQGDTLLQYPDHPMLRAVEKAGPGWLVAYIHPEITEEVFVEADMSGCQAMAMAAYTGNSGDVEATWVLLFDSNRDARAVGRDIERFIKINEFIGNDVRSSWITDVDTDGEFVVVKAILEPDEAVEYLTSFW